MTQKPPAQGGPAHTMLLREDSGPAGGGYGKAAGSVAVGEGRA